MSPRPKHPFTHALHCLAEHYSGLLDEHGDTPPGVQWRDRETQERRMEILAEVGDLRTAKILDFGCGTGHLLDFLRRRARFSGEYVGDELSTDMIALATRKFPDARFETRDVLASGFAEDFDYVLISGVFHIRVEDSWDLLTETLRRLFTRTRRAIAFNAMSTYVDHFDRDQFYVSPTRIFQFCKEQLSPCVTIRHDYLLRPDTVPYEFTVYVHAADVAPRTELEIDSHGSAADRKEPCPG